jgi:hypothetical protein
MRLGWIEQDHPRADAGPGDGGDTAVFGEGRGSSDSRQLIDVLASTMASSAGRLSVLTGHDGASDQNGDYVKRNWDKAC